MLIVKLTYTYQSDLFTVPLVCDNIASDTALFLYAYDLVKRRQDYFRLLMKLTISLNISYLLSC